MKIALRRIVLALLTAIAFTPTELRAQSDAAEPNALLLQSQADADGKSTGCLTCHTATDSPTMHTTGTVRLGCTDCHGGNSEIRASGALPSNSAESLRAKRQAHPESRRLDANQSANPVRVYTDWLREDWNYVRFVNPGDLRVAENTCGSS